MVLEMVKGYDNIDLDMGMALDLPFCEGAGAVTHNIARPYSHGIDLHGPPVWQQEALSNITVLNFDGANDYLDCPNAETADLGFTTGSYTFLCWVWVVVTATSQIVAGRYAVDVGGWEIYLDPELPPAYLTLRHHHASLGAGNLRDGCYSIGWLTGQWWMIGISRSDLYPVMYRNGLPVDMSYGPNGMRDPDATGSDLVIGARFTKNANHYHGLMRRPRMIARAYSDEEIWRAFQMERPFFGV